jgi:hypothetical protein
MANQGDSAVSLLRSLALAGTLVLLGAAAPACAALTFNALTFNALTFNALTFNALTFNALTFNALATTGSAIADLNGVAVEGISLPPVTHR